MNNTALIVFLVIIAAQVVAGIVQKIAKDQNRRGPAKAKPTPRRTATPQPPSAQAQRGVTPVPKRGGSTPTPAAGSSRLDDLSARRRAQLEELRRRRGATQVKVPQKPTVGPAAPPAAATPRSRSITSVGSGKRPGQTTGQAPTRSQKRAAARPVSAAPAQKKIQELGTGLSALRVAEEAERRRREELLRAKRAAEEVHARRTAQREARDAQERLRARQEREREQLARRRTRGERRNRIRQMLSHNAIRDLVVLREILDEPVSLRRQSFRTPTG